MDDEEDEWLFSFVVPRFAAIISEYYLRRYNRDFQNRYVTDPITRAMVDDSIRNQPRELANSFYDKYKVPLPLFQRILSEIEPDIMPHSHNGLSAATKLRCFFQVISTNDSLRSLVEVLQTNKDAIRRAFLSVCLALVKPQGLYDKWVVTSDASVVKQATDDFCARLCSNNENDPEVLAHYYAIKHEMAHCYGSIDGMVIRLANQSQNLHDVHRKSVLSVSFVVATDAMGSIRHMGIGSGTTQDSSMMRTTFHPFFDMLNAHDSESFLFGERGFGIAPHVLTPYRDVDTEDVAENERRQVYNTCLKSVCVHMDRCLRYWKATYKILQAYRYSREHIDVVLRAIATVYNGLLLHDRGHFNEMTDAMADDEIPVLAAGTVEAIHTTHEDRERGEQRRARLAASLTDSYRAGINHRSAGNTGSLLP